MLTFVILAALLLAGGVAVITLRQPVHAALALVATLLTLAVVYISLDAHFLAAIQVIVYAGAIMVLFLFVIMLLNVEGQPPVARPAWLRPATAATGLIGSVAVALIVWSARRPLPAQEQIDAVLHGGSAERIGTILFSEHLLAFHLVGVLLLTGLVAAVSLVQRPAKQNSDAAGSH